MNREKFFDEVRRTVFGGSLKQTQVQGTEALLDYAEKNLSGWDKRWIAYVLATAYHETAHTMLPIKELGSDKYLRAKKYWPYIGRGYVQLTWDYNYDKYGIKDNPDKALEPAFAAYVIYDGMAKGVFTGKKLSDYFSSKVDDPKEARRIVNGTDKADLIAGYHRLFLSAILNAQDAVGTPVEVKEPSVIVLEPTAPAEPVSPFWALVRTLIDLFLGNRK